MNSQVNWRHIHLKSNPFGITPPTNPKDIVWAGMTKLKNHFNMIYKDASFSPTTQVVLNRGNWGGGKTHASLYFANEDNLPSEVKDRTQVYTINLRAPKEPDNPVQDFYTNFLEKLGLTLIQERISNVINNHSEAEVLQSLHEVLDSEELARAFWLLGTEVTEEKQALLRTFFFGGCTSTDLKKLGLARKISNAQDRFKVIAGILQCIIGFDKSHDLSQHTRVFLWIDEMEDFTYLPSSQFRILSQGIREIIDKLPNFFTLFLNMSLAEPEMHEDFEAILGKAVVDRITDNVYFPELEPEEAMDYVRKLVNHPYYRDTPLPQGYPSTHPFDETALSILIEYLNKRTPMEINRQCTQVINNAFRDNIFEEDRSIETAYILKLEKRGMSSE